ncbi:sel1 repeat family protein, partial [Escherichia coli]
IYERGWTGKEDPEAALKYHKLAVEAGDIPSLAYMGYLYQYGKGVPKDYKKAFKSYKNAADSGNAAGMYGLGSMYDDGVAVKRNNKEAIKWYLKAAELGNNNAMSALGYKLMHGEGIKKDYSKARSLLEQAISLGNDYAMNHLGYMYLKGLGVKQDYRKASELYQAACDKDDETGCENVAAMKAKGTFRSPSKQQNAKSDTQRLIAKSIDKGVNATFTWQGDDAVFTANDGKVDCTFLKDFSEKGGNLATSFVCTDNVQIILKQFRDTKNAYLAVMTDNFNTEVKSFSVNVYVTNTGSN